MEAKSISQPVPIEDDVEGQPYQLLILDDDDSDAYEREFIWRKSDAEAIDEGQILANLAALPVKVSRILVMDQPLGDVREKIAIVQPSL